MHNFFLQNTGDRNEIVDIARKPDRKLVALKLYFDYRSPFSYLIKDPVRAIERDFAGKVVVDWLPFAFFVEEAFGLPEQRTKYHLNKVKYAYHDVRRWANSRDPPLTILGPKRVYDSSIAMMGGLFASKKWGKAAFERYTDLVFQRFFTRTLDIEAIDEILAVLEEATKGNIINTTTTNNNNRATSAHDDHYHQQLQQPWSKEFTDFVIAEGEGQKELAKIQRQGEAEGVFGVPTLVLGGELFFGNDRVDWARQKLTLMLEKRRTVDNHHHHHHHIYSS